MICEIKIVFLNGLYL